MHFEALRIQDLRVVREAVLHLAPGVNLLLGANAAGKTTVLEALSLLARGRTFRRGGASTLVRTGATESLVEGRVMTGGGGRVAERVRVHRGRVQAWCDGAVVRSRATLARSLPMVILGADAVSLVEGGPAARRHLVDWTGFFCHPDYLQRVRAYRRALQQRNAALRRGDDALAAWDEAAAEAGEALTRLRRASVEAMNRALTTVTGWPWRGTLEISYRPGWPEGATLLQALAERRALDRRSGVTGAGPHRADMRLRVREEGVALPMSRGQMKFAALCAALAQAEAIGAATGERPVLLVDDLAAELDQCAAEVALRALAEFPGQVVAAGLGREREAGIAARVFHVEHGEVTEVV